MSNTAPETAADSSTELPRATNGAPAPQGQLAARSDATAGRVSEDIASADALASRELVFAPVQRAKHRSNGWNEAVQRAFIEALANSGSVKAACKKVGRATTGAYQLRRQPDAREFAAAWDAALAYGMLRVEDEAIDRAINGTEETVHYHGELVATRRRYNERLVMFMLCTRLAEKYGDGTAPGQKGAVGKMQLRRLKKKWKAKWEAKRRKKEYADTDEVLQSINGRLQLSFDRRLAAMSPRTRAAHDEYRRLEALDEEEGYDPYEDPAHAFYAERHGGGRQGDAWSEPADDWMALPEPEEEEALPEPGGPRIRTLKDEGW